MSDLLWHVFSPIHCRLRYYWIFKLGSNFWVYESYMKPQSFKIQMNQWYSSDLNSAIGWLLLLILWTKSHIAMNSNKINIIVFSSITLWHYFVSFSLLYKITSRSFSEYNFSVLSLTSFSSERSVHKKSLFTTISRIQSWSLHQTWT